MTNSLEFKERVGSEIYSRQAFQILRFGFTMAPLLAGADKFFHFLTNWDQYLAPTANSVLGGRGHEFMLVVGVIEVAAGLGVAWKPRWFPMLWQPGYS